jgi:hypothetical protein
MERIRITSGRRAPQRLIPGPVQRHGLGQAARLLRVTSRGQHALAVAGSRRRAAVAVVAVFGSGRRPGSQVVIIAVGRGVGRVGRVGALDQDDRVGAACCGDHVGAECGGLSVGSPTTAALDAPPPGLVIGRDRAARLMQLVGLSGAVRGKPTTITTRRAATVRSPWYRWLAGR